MSSISFDKLIEYQKVNQHESWKQDGKPRGMFYHPKDSSYFAMCSMSFTLPFSKPAWVEEDINAQKLYSNYKFWGKVIKWYAIAFIPLTILVTSI